MPITYHISAKLEILIRRDLHNIDTSVLAKLEHMTNVHNNTEL